ncbi:hypothetical protein Tco_0154441 [Tanacetum coccineum]
MMTYLKHIFISIGSAEDERLIKRMNEKGVDLSKSEVIKEESKEEVQEENKDEEIPDEEKEVDYEILDKKYPIKEWKTECLGARPQTDQAEHLEEINLNVVIRSNGQKRYFSTLMTRLVIFDREDLNAVYQLVMEKYQDEMPEGFDRVLWGHLMVMFNPDDKNEFWNAQHDWKIVRWSCWSTDADVKMKLGLKKEKLMAWECLKFVKKILAELESEE